MYVLEASDRTDRFISVSSNNDELGTAIIETPANDAGRYDTVREAPEEWMKLPTEPKKLFRLMPMPAVKSRAADSPTMRPMARIQPEYF